MKMSSGLNKFVIVTAKATRPNGNILSRFTVGTFAKYIDTYRVYCFNYNFLMLFTGSEICTLA